MKAGIERLFEMLTRRFIKAFLSQCTQSAGARLAPAFPNPQILLSDYPETGPGYLTFRKSCLISCPDTLTLDTMTPDTRFARVPPILCANPPILCGSSPILHSSHPIQRGNHPRGRWQGVMCQGVREIG